MRAKLFVANLSRTTTERDLARLFSEVGEVRSTQIPLDRKSGEPRGFGYIELGTPDEAERAIERLDGHEIGGHRLRVDWAREEAPGRSRPQSRREVDADEADFTDGDPSEEDAGRPGRLKRSRRSRATGILDDVDDYVDDAGTRWRRHGKHGADRLHRRGTRRSLD